VAIGKLQLLRGNLSNLSRLRKNLRPGNHLFDLSPIGSGIHHQGSAYAAWDTGSKFQSGELVCHGFFCQASQQNTCFCYELSAGYRTMLKSFCHIDYYACISIVLKQQIAAVSHYAKRQLFVAA
jgi:hypothetical protein